MDEFGSGPVGSANLIERVKAILLKPKEEWPRIDAEPATIADIYRGYVVPLAAIGPICSLIGLQLFGIRFFGIVWRPSLLSAISSAIVQYVLTLVAVYVLALIIDALAPSFGGTSNRVQAFKVAAYAATASWIASVFGLVPQLALLAVLGGLYSLYLFWLGLPLLMKVSQDRAIGYVVIVIIAAIVIFAVLGMVAGAVMGHARMGYVGDTGQISGTMSVPGVGSVDIGKLQDAGNQMAAAAQGMEAAASGAASGTATAIDPGRLQGLLPAGIAGLARSSVSSESAGAAGLGGSHAEAQYGTGTNTIKLSVTDLGAARALAAFGSALNVQATSQDEHGYQKTGKVDGRMTTEKWDNDSHSGTYSVLVADRFMVEADGDGTTIDALKAAVGQVDFGALEQLARS